MKALELILKMARHGMTECSTTDLGEGKFILVFTGPLLPFRSIGIRSDDDIFYVRGQYHGPGVESDEFTASSPSLDLLVDKLLAELKKDMKPRKGNGRK
jgi:hypothetical protein